MKITDTFRAPREILKWLDKMNLKYSVKQFNHDIRNGIVAGEILKFYDKDFNE